MNPLTLRWQEVHEPRACLQSECHEMAWIEQVRDAGQPKAEWGFPYALCLQHALDEMVEAVSWRRAALRPVN